MAVTANESIRDALIRHQVNLQRLGVGLSNEAIGLLDKVEAQIADEIRKAAARGAAVDTSRGLRELQFLEDAIRSIREGAYQAAFGNVNDSVLDLVRHEAEFSANNLDVNSPVQLDVVLPSVTTLETLVKAGTVEGHTLSDWFERVQADDTRRIVDGVRIGMTRGSSIDDIIRSVIGTTAADGGDGITNLSRRYISSLVRTAVNSFSNQAREITMEANSDLVGFEVYTATLDSRTTLICQSLDGKVYPVGEGKFPPQHFGCRSIRVAMLSQDLAGTRPMNPTTERQLVREYNDLNGTSALTRDDLPRGTKGDFDAYAQKRVRELIGTVPASTNYQDFLTRQSASYQDEVLGVAKGKLFRSGGLSLSKFVHRDGSELTLAELAQSNRDAFTKAGLDPTLY